jgi:flagellar basal-body rod modification protein FlgD
VYFDGSPMELKPNTPALAEAAELVVRRPDGTEVQRLELNTAAETVSWAGVGANGEPLPKGVYKLSVEASAQGEDLPVASVEAYQRIQEVKSIDGVTTLVTNGAIEIPATSVTSLRQPI